MSKTATELLNDRMLEDVMSDDGLGYPSSTGFVAEDLPGFELVVLRNLVERTPAVVVHASGFETLFHVSERDDDPRVEVYSRALQERAFTRRSVHPGGLQSEASVLAAIDPSHGPR